jgi:quercetin dioxygenase-like cupin family protein
MPEGANFIVSQPECVPHWPFPGVEMHTMEGERMTLSIVDMQPQAVIPEHSHPHEQIGYMVSGEAEFIIQGRSHLVRAGQMWRLPGGVPHQVVTRQQPMRAIDVFYPRREDMRHSRDCRAGGAAGSGTGS